MEPQAVKSPFLSKTNWLNFVMATAAFFPEAQAFIVGHPGLSVGVLAGANILLRLVTKSKLSLE